MQENLEFDYDRSQSRRCQGVLNVQRMAWRMFRLSISQVYAGVQLLLPHLPLSQGCGGADRKNFPFNFFPLRPSFHHWRVSFLCKSYSGTDAPVGSRTRICSQSQRSLLIHCSGSRADVGRDQLGPPKASPRINARLMRETRNPSTAWPSKGGKSSCKPAIPRATIPSGRHVGVSFMDLDS